MKPMQHARASARTGGFTLIEVLVTITIMSLLITACHTILWTTVKAKELVQQLQKASHAGPAILGVLCADLRGAVPPSTGREIFMGGPGNPNDNNGGFLRLTTSAEPATVQTLARNTLTEVTYYVKPNRGEHPPNLFSLYRGERTLQGEGGNFRLLYDRVKSIALKYRLPNGDDIDYWTMDLQALPIAVHIELVIESEAKEHHKNEPTAFEAVPEHERRSHTFATIVPLPCGGTVAEGLVINLEPAAATVAGGAAPTAAGETRTTGFGSRAPARVMSEEASIAIMLKRAMAATRYMNQSVDDYDYGGLGEAARRAFGPNWLRSYENYLPSDLPPSYWED